MSSTDQATYLQQHKAWNWKWPVNGNCWNTNAQVKGKASKAPNSNQRLHGRQPYHGPSKKTLGKRAAKAQRRNR